MKLGQMLVSTVLALLLSPHIGAQTLSLSLLSKGAADEAGGVVPLRVVLSTSKPASVTKVPQGLAAPRFGVLNMGPAESKRAYVVLLDEPDQGVSRLWVDMNGDGDLTNDPPAEWQRREMPGSGGKTMVTYFGGGTLMVATGSKPAMLHLVMYKFDRNDPMRAGLKDSLMYFSDYALQGKLTIGAETYRVMLSDTRAAGDFRPVPTPEGAKAMPAVRLLIDRNHDGIFTLNGEVFDASKPFNLGGTTYELKMTDAMGSGAQLVKSAVTVAEVPAPPDLRVGKVAVAFEAKTTDGAAVRFPDSYRGKLVLLDFWATWCGPCVGEIPGLVKAYEKFKARGFDVIGVSLDQPNMAERLAAFTREKGMAWPQVYDGKYWKADVAQRFGITSIPSPFLVDGDTGRIVARGESLRGEALEQTIETCLAKRK